MDLVIARNPDPDSSLPFLLKLPLGDGLLFKVKDTWPRTASVYCHPLPREQWPAEPDIVECVPLVSCTRRGKSIDIVLNRGRENRSQLVFTTSKGRETVFWNSARTRKQARPSVSVPAARAAGMADLEIIVDTRERYAYRFANKPVSVVKRPLPHGDYATSTAGRLIASVERKSLHDLATSLTSGKLTYALGGLAAAVPRAALVVEDRYSQLFKLTHVRPAVVADGLAQLQVRYPNVPILFCETAPWQRSGSTGSWRPPTSGREAKRTPPHASPMVPEMRPRTPGKHPRRPPPRSAAGPRRPDSTCPPAGG